MKLDHEKMMDMVREIAPMIGGEFENASEDMWRGFIRKDDMRIMFDCWQSKGRVIAWLYREGDKHATSKAGEIGCDFSRGADAVAREVTRRLLPVAETFAAVKRDAWKAESDRVATVNRKAESLRKKYPCLKISVRDDQGGILISTKYGAGITLSGYVYHDSRTDKWCLTGDRHAPNLRIDDIDSRDGRAILAIISKNGN